MALLHQRNGLERANPRWHTNQSLSITMMTDFLIINMPAVLHMKSTPYSLHLCSHYNLKGLAFIELTHKTVMNR